MRNLLIYLVLLSSSYAALGQRGFNYYKDSSRVGSPNKKAYDYFKKAYYDHIWTWTKQGADSAEYYLKLAIKEDPDYSAAYAFLAHVYQFKTYNNQERDKMFALEKQNAEKALSFRPVTGDGYSVMADVKWEEKDTVSALSLLRKAILQEPDNVGNYIWAAIRFGQMGQDVYYDSAAIALHKIIGLDPQYGQAYMKLGNLYHWRRPMSDSAKYYYHKAIGIYNTVRPRDNRMMDGYYWLGELFREESKYDSASRYYNLFLKEIEPSEMYIREMRLSSTYRALSDCYLAQARKRLDQFIELNKRRVESEPKDAEFLLGILAGEYMQVEQDSVLKTYALPLARRIQTLSSKDPYTKVFAVYYEYVALKRLKRKNEAVKVLESYVSKEPKEPVTLLELGRMKILGNEIQAGLAYLRRARQNLNEIVTKEGFVEELKGPDFAKVRSSLPFKGLLK